MWILCKKMIYQEFIVSNPGHKLVYRESTSVTSMHGKKKNPRQTNRIHTKKKEKKKRQDVKYLPTVKKIST